mgnify:CR=1 FL=1
MRKGTKMSEESCNKMRAAAIGRVPWNKGLHDGTCKGFTGKHNESSKEKMRLAKLGKPGNHTGKKHSEESKQKNRESHLGKPAWNEGIKMPESFCKTMSEVQKGKEITELQKEKICETLIGGFWYGNVRYGKLQYCELWKDVNPRVHAFFNNTCCLCGAKENGKSFAGHHIFYVKKACCWFNKEGIYYTNLNARDHKEHDYCIGENPNYFVILCPKCHGMTNGDFENRKKWADYFKEMIDTKYNGKCYFSREEMAGDFPPG